MWPRTGGAVHGVQQVWFLDPTTRVQTKQRRPVKEGLPSRPGCRRGSTNVDVRSEKREVFVTGGTTTYDPDGRGPGSRVERVGGEGGGWRRSPGPSYLGRRG